VDEILRVLLNFLCTVALNELKQIWLLLLVVGDVASMGKEAAECFFKEVLLLRLSTYLSGIIFAWDNCNWLLFELTHSLKELSE